MCCMCVWPVLYILIYVCTYVCSCVLYMCTFLHTHILLVYVKLNLLSKYLVSPYSWIGSTPYSVPVYTSCT